MKISKKVAGVEYAIRDIVVAARQVEKQGKKITDRKSTRLNSSH